MQTGATEKPKRPDKDRGAEASYSQLYFVLLNDNTHSPSLSPCLPYLESAYLSFRYTEVMGSGLVPAASLWIAMECRIKLRVLNDILTSCCVLVYVDTA